MSCNFPLEDPNLEFQKWIWMFHGQYNFNKIQVKVDHMSEQMQNVKIWMEKSYVVCTIMLLEVFPWFLHVQIWWRHPRTWQFWIILIHFHVPKSEVTKSWSLGLVDHLTVFVVSRSCNNKSLTQEVSYIILDPLHQIWNFVIVWQWLFKYCVVISHQPECIVDIFFSTHLFKDGDRLLCMCACTFVTFHVFPYNCICTCTCMFILYTYISYTYICIHIHIYSSDIYLHIYIYINIYNTYTLCIHANTCTSNISVYTCIYLCIHVCT